ncbi:HEPN domain-containing protein [Thermanaerosceptrum fracticalcis]|uniref:HEPN domain-containing protein n=1 Tax=Thermanaerosceptrum fracticalcis TaxID=1712410 RepID=A0A7G6E035_THEFR|nr:HEPN domain-containing protein [Thermanaerosceptrum fracticalcis]QNB45439.1 HEPN domain-containing protein [Thermanaerosceptrum fracticalcis]
MSKEEKVNEWLMITEEDLDVAVLCFKGSKYLHCAYMCQQAVEKALKALITANGQVPSPIHDLYALAEDAEIDDALTTEQKFFLRALTTYAIAARYPERKKKLYSLCKQEEAEKLLRLAEVFVSWIKEKINEKLLQEKRSLEN